MYDNYEMNKRLMEDYHSGDPVKKQKAVELLLKSIEPFIHRFLQNYKSFFTPDNYEDFFNTACEGVLVSLKKYNPEMSLTTFAPFEMKRAIQRYISDIRGIKPHYSQRINNIVRVTEKLKGMGIENPTPKDISEVLGITEKQVIEALQIKDSSLVWNYENEDECSNLFNVHAESPEEIIEKKEVEKLLIESLKQLEDLEKCCILHAYGACGFSQLKYQDIADKYNITIYEVKVKVHKALKSLRKSMRSDSKSNNVCRKQRVLDNCEIPVFNNCNINIYINECDKSIKEEIGEGCETLDLK